jgi:protein-tyrosine sulfotransferase
MRRTSKYGEIFVLSLPRAGSTLLRMILDSHQDGCCPGELRLGQLSQDLYHAVYFGLAQASTSQESAKVAIATAKTQEIIESFMGAYAAVKRKTLWAEKTPANIDYADKLSEVFPDAAYLCLYRNLLDVIRSGWESTRYGKLRYELWDYESGIAFCVRQTRRLFDFERKHSDRALRIHYERLVERPVDELGRVFNFLGLDWNPSLIDDVFSTSHDPGPGDPKAEFATRFYTTSIGRGTCEEVLSEVSKAPKSLQNDLNILQRELGYGDVDFAFGNSVPNKDNVGTTPASRSFGSIGDLFNLHFRSKLDQGARRAPALKGAVKFVVKGGGGGTWTINLNARPPAIQSVDRDADCTITIRADDLRKLASGELNVGECYLQARLRVTGNEALALSLGHTLFA